MDQPTPFSVASSSITTTSTSIITSTPAPSKSVIVDPSSSDEKSGPSSALFSSIPSASADPQHTPKRVSSTSTGPSPVLTPTTVKILSRNYNGTSE